MVAQVTKTISDELIVVLGDAHVYLNHFDQVSEQVYRTPYAFPTLEIDPSITNIDDFRPEHFKLVNYSYHPSIPAPIAV
jgi:thymidylate synthase